MHSNLSHPKNLCLFLRFVYQGLLLALCFVLAIGFKSAFDRNLVLVDVSRALRFGNVESRVSLFSQLVQAENESQSILDTNTIAKLHVELGYNVAWSKDEPTGAYLVDAGDKARIDGELDQAIYFYQEAILASPEVAGVAQFGIGQSFAERDDFENALTSFEQAEDTGYDRCDLHHAKAEAYASQKLWEQAVESFERVGASLSDCRYGKGYLLYRIGSIRQYRLPLTDPATVRQTYIDGLNSGDFRPEPWLDSDTHWQLGLLSTRLGDALNAQRQFEMAVRLRPKQYHAWVSLADNRALLRQWDLAESAAKTAILLQPERPQAYRVLGQVYLESEQQEAALKTFQKLLLLEPDDKRIKEIVSSLTQ